MPDSDFAKNPKATVKRVVDDYENGRRMLIKSLEQQERMRNMNR